MSRIGKAVIELPKGVSLEITKTNLIKVKGPKGELAEQINPDIVVTNSDGNIEFTRPTEQPRHRAMHGLSRALVNNMVTGVSTGFSKHLELVGVGYRVTNTGNLLELILGYSHPIYFLVPKEVTVETKAEKGQNPQIILSGIDKQLIGQVAAKVRGFRKPEPYKGKGVRFFGEDIRRKAGKTASKK